MRIFARTSQAISRYALPDAYLHTRLCFTASLARRLRGASADFLFSCAMPSSSSPLYLLTIQPHEARISIGYRLFFHRMPHGRSRSLPRLMLFGQHAFVAFSSLKRRRILSCRLTTHAFHCILSSNGEHFATTLMLGAHFQLICIFEERFWWRFLKRRHFLYILSTLPLQRYELRIYFHFARKQGASSMSCYGALLVTWTAFIMLFASLVFMTFNWPISLLIIKAIVELLSRRGFIAYYLHYTQKSTQRASFSLHECPPQASRYF